VLIALILLWINLQRPSVRVTATCRFLCLLTGLLSMAENTAIRVPINGSVQYTYAGPGGRAV